MAGETQERQASPEPIATNTLILTNLTPEAFEQQGQAVRDLLQQSYGSLARLVILKSFGRMLAVFADTHVAMRAKTELHKTQFQNKELRVYYGQHTDLNQLDPNAGVRLNLLQVPEIERNFLLSPPGSPPVGWEQPKEAHPVAGGHSEALIELHMSALSLAAFALDGGEEIDLRPKDRAGATDGSVASGSGLPASAPLGATAGSASVSLTQLTHSSLESVTGEDGRHLEILRFSLRSPSQATAGEPVPSVDESGLPIVVIESNGGGGGGGDGDGDEKEPIAFDDIDECEVDGHGQPVAKKGSRKRTPTPLPKTVMPTPAPPHS
ncbi:Calcipressin-domain-containing protein [Entophlyctis helioformis]|nr:Calcipressin-domain-containing protein [Entophlyctis helioformis]